jgi:hypothetical protein
VSFDESCRPHQLKNYGEDKSTSNTCANGRESNPAGRCREDVGQSSVVDGVVLRFWSVVTGLSDA